MHGNVGVLVMEVGAVAGIQIAAATRCPCTNNFLLDKTLLAQMQREKGKQTARS